jgi:hypothetical protein
VWVGGTVLLPFYVDWSDQVFRPQAAIWAEFPTADRILSFRMQAGPDQPAPSLTLALRDAIEQPYHGSPRRPDVIRIADPNDVRRVQDEVGDDVRVAVAPTPELAPMMARFAAHLAHHSAESSYFDTDITPATVAELFEAARTFYAAKPWRLMAQRTPLRLDILNRRIEGQVLVVVGRGRSPRGLWIFPSLDGFDAFLEASPHMSRTGEAFNLGTRLLTLTFERAIAIDPQMRREVMANGWPVAGVNAFPVVEHYDPDGVRRPLTAFDVNLTASAASLVATFILRHGERLAAKLPVVRSEWYVHGSSEAWLTSPPDAPPEWMRRERGPQLRLAQILLPPRRKRGRRPQSAADDSFPPPDEARRIT